MTTRPPPPRIPAPGAPAAGGQGPDRPTTGAQSDLERLRERADRFERLIDDAALGVAVHREGRLLYVNDACAALLGYASPQAMLTEPDLLAHVIGADRPRIAGIVSPGAASAAPGDAPVHCEMNLRHRDGTAISVQGALRSVGWEGGPAVQITVTDLTTRDAVEKALRWSEQRFKDFSEAAGDGFWETGAEHRVTYLSHRFEEVTGFVVTQFIGKRRTDAAGADVEQPPWDSHVADLEARRPFRDFTYSVADTNGRRRYFRINGLPSFDRDGRFRGYRGTGLEVTERIEADVRLRTAERRLIEAMEHIPDGYALFDTTDRLVHCNRTWRDVLNPGIADIIAPGLEFEQAVQENVRRGYIVDAVDDPEAWIAERMSRHREALGTPFEVVRGDGVWNLVREHRTRDDATTRRSSSAATSPSSSSASSPCARASAASVTTRRPRPTGSGRPTSSTGSCTCPSATRPSRGSAATSCSGSIRPSASPACASLPSRSARCSTTSRQGKPSMASSSRSRSTPSRRAFTR